MPERLSQTRDFKALATSRRAKKPLDRELYMREHEYNNQVSSIRAPIERAVAHLKTWKILFTDYRRPLNTFLDSFRAAIGLYFFELSFHNPPDI